MIMKVITIGRSSEGNDIVIDDPMVSRHHFQIIQMDDGSYRLADFGSSNGTYINGRKVTGEVPLDRDDFVRVGNTIVRWRSCFESNFTNFDSVTSESTEENPDEETGKGGSKVGRIIGWIIGIVLSSITAVVGLVFWLIFRRVFFPIIFIVLTAVGVLLLIFNIIMLIVFSKKNN